MLVKELRGARRSVRGLQHAIGKQPRCAPFLEQGRMRESSIELIQEAQSQRRFSGAQGALGSR
jgi:hypothetical protein